MKHLLVRGNLCNTKYDVTDIVSHPYKPCDKKCDSCDNFVAIQSHVICNAMEESNTLSRIALIYGALKKM